MQPVPVSRAQPLVAWFRLRRPAQDVLLLLLLNVIIRALWLLWMHPAQQADFLWYYNHAVSMVEGQGYSSSGKPTAYWPIGYPFFLSLLFRITGPSAIAGMIANAVLSVGIVLLVYVLGRQVFAGLGAAARPAALAAAVGYTLLPSQIEWNAVLGSEELATCLMLLSITLYLQAHVASSARRVYGWIALAGIALGLSCDVRPIPLLFPVFLFFCERVAFRCTWGQAAARAVWMAALMALAVSPVTIRNAIVMHHFIIISTNGGVNLWQGTHANGSYFWSWLPWINPLLAVYNNEVARNAVAMHVAVQFMLHHPLRTVWNGMQKIFFLYWVDWNVVSVTFAALQPAWPKWAITAAMWFDTSVYWVWMLVMLRGGARLVRLMPRQIAVPLAAIVYQTAVFFFFPAWDRFRYPIMPLFALAFGVGWLLLCGRRWSVPSSGLDAAPHEPWGVCEVCQRGIE